MRRAWLPILALVSLGTPLPAGADAAGEGSLNRDQIRTVVRAHIDDIRHCYNQGLVKDPDLAGRVVVRFSIGPDGRVTRSRAVESTVRDSGVVRCMVRAVERWRFPEPLGGGRVEVSYPFVLEPG